MTEKRYFGLKTDGAFNLVMSDNDIVLRTLRAILPEANIQEIVENTAQKQFDSLGEEKDIRLDIFVRDVNMRLFDVEMQVRNSADLGRRMRYYQSKMDMEGLNKGNKYKKLSDSYIIFFCDFDPFGKGRAKYVFHLYEDDDKSLGLRNGSTNVIINAKADPESQHPSISEDFRALLHVLQEDYSAKESFARILTAKLNKVNEDPVTRRKIMTLQTRLEDERAIGIEEGRQEAIRELELLQAKKELASLERLTAKTRMPVSEAMTILGISSDDLIRYRQLVAENKKLN